MKRHRLGLYALGFAGALLASTAALAGFRTGQQVVISDTDRLANGDLGYVSNTADARQYIGCERLAGLGACFAIDQSGLIRSCSTSDTNLLSVIGSLRGDSYLIFYWDTSGHCTDVVIENQSASPPKR